MRIQLTPEDLAKIKFSDARAAAELLVKVIDRAPYIPPEAGECWQELFQRACEQLQIITDTLRIGNVQAERIKELEAALERVRAVVATD